jgi:nucleotide-binding universal stress UspA family protein
MQILIATGGASHSDVAVRLAAAISQLTGGKLTILTVIKRETERPQAEAILTRARTLVSPEVAEVRARIRLGQPAEAIVQEAREGAYDLIVVGESRGTEGPEHGLTRRFLAPTAERVIQQLPCPVLIARGRGRPLRRMLVCEGGRDPSLLNRLITSLAPLLKTVDELTVLHVMSQITAGPGVPDWELEANAEELIQKHTREGELLEDDLERLEQLNVRLEAKVRHGLVVEEILDEARSGDYDLVVIGAHQRKGWARFLLDDLAHEIIVHADRPLLVV